MATSLQWHEASPGKYERDLDPSEYFYLAANLVKSPVVNKADWYLNAGVKLECSRPDFVSDVRQAWVKTRFDYPALAATIVDNKWTYRTAADAAEFQTWMEETFHVHREPLTARELMSEEMLVPGTRITLHVLPNTQELMIQGPHTHLDGFGIMKTFQHAISCLVKIPLSPDIPAPPVEFGKEYRNLSPAMSLCCPTPAISAQDKEKWNKLINEFIEPSHKICLKTANETDPPRFSRTQFLIFDATSTKGIQLEAQKRGVSLAAVVQGAVSLAARDHGGQTNTVKRHAFQALYSAREYVNPLVTDGERVVSPLIMGVPLNYTLHDDFQALITEANAVLQDGKVDKFGLKCSALWGSDLPKAFGAALPEGKLIPAEPQMSYVGHMGMYLREWNEDETIEGSLTQCVDYWCSLDMLSANVVTSVYIFRGLLNLSLAYNETFHSEESMSAYLRMIKGKMDGGLGLQTEASLRTPGREEWMPEPMTI